MQLPASGIIEMLEIEMRNRDALRKIALYKSNTDIDID